MLNMLLYAMLLIENVYFHFFFMKTNIRYIVVEKIQTHNHVPVVEKSQMQIS